MRVVEWEERHGQVKVVATTDSVTWSSRRFNVSEFPDGSQQGMPPQGYSRSSTPTYDGSREGHRAREPYVSYILTGMPEIIV
jgi:hypothetical protein